MRKLFRKTASIALAALMALSLIPSTVMAEEPEVAVTTYKAVLTQSEHGSIAFSDGAPEQNLPAQTPVLISVYPEDGYQLGSMNAVSIDTGATVELSYLAQAEAGTVTMYMPEANVSVSASFAEIPQEIPDEQVVQEEQAELPEESESEEEPASIAEEGSTPEETVVPEIPPVVQEPEKQEEAVEATDNSEKQASLPENPEETQEQEIVQPESTKQEEIQPEVPAEPEVMNGTLLLTVQEDGGQVVINTQDGAYTINSADGQKSMTDPTGAVIYADAQNAYDFAIEREIGSVVTVSVIPMDGYKVSEYALMTDTGDAAKMPLDIASATDITIGETAQNVVVSFAKKDIYEIEGFDYSTLSGIDFSTGRLIVGTTDPSIFVDNSVIISELNGLYLLQFEDAAVAMKAYAYYLTKAEVVEVDGKIMAINTEAEIEQPVSDVMTENSNPFTEAVQAVYETNGAFDVAIIDTGANGHVASAVSVIGDYNGDDNGHGTLMATLIEEQNPNARILSIKAFEGDGLADLSAIYAAFQYAMTQNVKIINISASALSLNSAVLADAISEAVASGKIVVASAGNNGRDASWYIPASLPGVMTIGACDEDGVRIASSNFGSCVEYNVVAETTSEAAAKFSGWLSANGMENIEEALNQGLIFETSYVKEEDPEENELLKAFREFIEENPTIYEVKDYLAKLSVNDAQDLYTMLTQEDMAQVEDIAHRDLGITSGTAKGDALAHYYVANLFSFDLMTINTQPNEKVIAQAYQGIRDQVGDAMFTVTDEHGGTFTAYCVEGNLLSPVEGAPGVAMESKLQADDSVLKYIQLVGPEGPLYGTIDFQTYVPTIYELMVGFTDPATGVTFTKEGVDSYVVHLMASGKYSGLMDDETWDATVRSALMNCADSIKRQIQSNPGQQAYAAKAATYVVSYASVEVHTPLQDISYTDFNANGQLRIHKYSSDPTLVIDGTNFRLDGATYGVYTDAACTKIVRDDIRFTTGTDGYSATLTIPKGRYYLKETSAPTGFQLDPNPIEVNVTYQNLTTAEHAEKPITGGVVFNKVVNKNPGKLTVSKEVQAVKFADKSFHFVLEYGPNTNYGTSVPFDLTGGKSKTFDIPAGYYYKVTETDYSADGWYTTVGTTRTNVTTGRIGDATVSNPYGGGQFKFTVSGYQTGWGQRVLENGGATPVYVAVSNGQFGGKGGCSYIVEGLTPGSTIRISETQPTSNDGTWVMSGTPSGTVEAGNNSKNIGTITNTFTPKAVSVTFKNELKTGSIQIKKSISTSGLTPQAIDVMKNSALYTSDGAEYTIYTDSNCTQKYGTEILKITADDATGLTGTSNVIDEIPFGTYYIKETKVPNENANLDATVYTVTIGWNTYSTTQVKSSSEEPVLGSIKLGKVSKVPSITNGHPCYSLNGAIYGIYLDAAGTKLYQEVTTNDAGEWNLENIPMGQYYIKELQPSRGYGLALCSHGGADIHIIRLSARSRTSTFTCEEPVDADPISVLLQKIDKETGKPYEVAGATFEGAEYTVKYYTNYDYSGTPERTWVFKTAADGAAQLVDSSLKEGSDALYKDASGTPVIPRGSFTIQETKAPKGYLLDNTVYKYVVNGAEIEYEGNDGSIHPISTTPTLAIDKGVNSAEQVSRGDIEFKKTNGGQEYIANCLFEVTNTATGETHYIVTDPNGVFNSSTGTKNNGNDAAVTANPDGTYTVDESALSYENGVWFSGDKEGNTASATQDNAAFPYGTYTFKEIETSVNEGLTMITFTANVYREGVYKTGVAVYDIGTKDDSELGQPTIRTVARDAEEMDKTVEAENEIISITDKVSYSNCVKGKEYVLEGKVWDKTNSEFYKDASGNDLVVTKTFTATNKEGYTNMDFTLSGEILRNMETKAIVVFEWLKDGEEILDAHTDPDDQDQMIIVVQPPEIQTILTDSIDGEHDAKATDNIVLKDTIAYRNLRVGRTYRIRGILMDKTTGAEARDDLDHVIMSDKTFTATEETGTVEVTFTFKGETLKNHDLVAFETLYWKNIEQALHEDINDEAQTVHVPEITTDLKDSVDSDSDALASEEIVLIDTVSYKNLLPGKSYTVTGTLMDKETGEPALDDNGQEITASSAFTAEEKDGSVDVTFTFSGVNLVGKSVVAFETLNRGDKEVAVHTDINDEEQTVDLPKIETTLTDTTDNEHDAMADEEITLVDRVDYENLHIGKQYTVKGVLMDQDTGKEILDDDGQKITAEAKFTAEAEDGFIELTFTFSGKKLAGKSVVAFEDLYRDDKHVSTHHDIEDENQTVDIPKIETTLTDVIDNEHDAFATENITLVDTVPYYNLLIGKEYTVKGVLMDKETGAPALDDNGEQITAEKTFTAVAKDGQIALEFTFSGKVLAGKTVVAFEDLYRGEKHVATHHDINDEDQSVHIPSILTTLVDGADEQHDVLASETVTLTDHVAFSNLLPGHKYVLIGILYDKETGEPAMDSNGEGIVAYKVFTPTTANGSVDVEFEFDGSTMKNRTLVAFEELYRNDKQVAVHEDINDEAQTIYIPEITTDLYDSIDEDVDALASEEIVLTDKVTYKNLIPGKEYTAKGTLMDQETGEPALNDNGESITAETTFTPETKDGFALVVFKFSGVKLAGKDVVAFEELHTTTKKVAVHTDIEDESQKVDIPKIETTLADSIDNDIDSLADTEMKLVDTVPYYNLVPGREYVLHGMLMDKATGEPALDDEGNTIESELTFTAEETNGSVDLEFTFSGTVLAGHTVVAFERLYREDKLVAIHCDIEDFDQSNWIPRIATTLKDTVDMDDDADATGDIVLIDNVEYFNLIPGRTYRMDGILMDAMTGEEALDDAGNTITASETFTAEDADGAIEIVFSFSGETLAGHTVVAFEDLFHVTYDADNPEEIVAEKKVATHHDIADDGQSVYIPKILTTLKDVIDNEHDAKATEEITLVDSVAYENLIVGREYKITGILMNQETGEPALDDEGNEIRGETTFTAETVNGSIDVTFTFGGVSLAGQTVVAFEDLYRGEKHLAVHADIEDENQFVHIPEIYTTLADVVDNEHDANATDKISLVDEVFYKNLIPGKEYVMNGVLMDKESGKQSLDDNGKAITAQAVFTPEQPDGSVKLTFTFEGVSLAGRSVVAFETLTRNDKELAVHADINDKEQTVDLPKIATVLTSPDGLHTAFREDKVVLTDTVTYTNLTVGQSYTMNGVLMDKTTGKEILNKDGKPVVSVQNFAPTEPDGTVTLEFVLDNLPQEGITAVAFETLVRNAISDTKDSKVVAEHKDLNDEAQTVAVPEIRTVLTGREGLKTINLLNTVTLLDNVIYTNLLPGHTYTMKGVIVSKSTGKAVIDAEGKEVRAEGTFTPESANGNVTLEFTFKAPETLEPAMVAFEYLYENDIKVAQHEDIKDADQTVSAVRIKTIAADEKGVKVFESQANNKVYDTVEFDGLEAGKEYILVGTLVSKTEKEANGKDPKVLATGELKFKTDQTSGKAVVEINLPANTYVGEAVAFEELLDAETGTVVAVHKDLTDADQTIWVAKVSTKAVFKDGSKKAHLGEAQTIVDEVSFEGLKPGTEYVVTTHLMNKSTGKPVTSLGKQVTATKEFKPTEVKGKVQVEITVPKQTVKGEVVVFEVVTEKTSGKVVARHEDIKDEAQTVEFFSNPKPNPTPNPTPKTGDPNNIWMFAGIGAGACLLAALMLVLYRRKKKNNL